MGGGLSNFIEKDSFLPGYTNKNGSRIDGRNLVQEWIDTRTQSQKRAKFIKNKSELDDLDPKDTDAVLGVYTVYS